MSEFVKPPSSNTGAEKPAPLENRSLLDWFAFTVFERSVTDVIHILGLHEDNFVKMETGGMGYKGSMMLGHIRIFYDGAANMGVHVEMSGQGCREYEAIRDANEPWSGLFKVLEDGFFLKSEALAADLTGARYAITRLDLAIDNVDGQLDLKRIKRSLKNGEVTSRFKTGRKLEKFILGDDFKPYAENGTTIYFGSASSRLQFRIYDKAAETGCVGPWVRFELQLRDERAKAAVSILRKTDMAIGHVTTGIIKNYLNFIDLTTATRRVRCSLATWWSKWLGNTEKLKLTIDKAVKTMGDVMAYLKKQYAPNLSIIQEFLGVRGMIKFMQEVIVDGMCRQKDKHRQILASAI